MQLLSVLIIFCCYTLHFSGLKFIYQTISVTNFQYLLLNLFDQSAFIPMVLLHCIYRFVITTMPIAQLFYGRILKASLS